MWLKILFSCIILSSILSCEKGNLARITTQIKTGPGPEDIVFDKINNRILASCSERRSGMPKVGEIYQINLYNEESTVLPRINYPGIPFNPHGFDLQTVNGIPYLFVINHYGDSLSTSSIIQFKINKLNLEFVKEFKNPLLISPNDLTVLSDGSFYFSNDRTSSSILELLANAKTGSVVYCNGISDWIKADSIIAFPNGLYNENNKLYLATSRNTSLFRYDIQPDGSLKNRTTLSTINGMDNISPNGNELIISVHPDLLKFGLLSIIPTLYSPSRTIAYNVLTGETRTIFNDDGQTISGSSTGLVVGNSLYLGQVFGEFVLKVENFQN